MTWFRVDDGFYSHPKSWNLSPSAVALWVRAGSYCGKHLTDGLVPRTILPLLQGDEDAAEELVRAGLWDEAPDGYEFHQWAEYQDARAKANGEGRRRRRHDGPTYLYWLMSDDETVIYVGITNSPKRRMQQHCDEKPWAWKVKHYRLWRFATRREAMDAERYWIHKLLPVYNRQENPYAYEPVEPDGRHWLDCHRCDAPTKPWTDVREDASWSWTAAYECRFCGARWSASWDYMDGQDLIGRDTEWH